LKRKEKNYRTKYVSLNNQSGDYGVNPKIIRNEIAPFKIFNLQVRLNKSSLISNDWRNYSNYLSNNYSYKVNMDAKINHRKKKMGIRNRIERRLNH